MCATNWPPPPRLNVNSWKKMPPMPPPWGIGPPSPSSRPTNANAWPAKVRSCATNGMKPSPSCAAARSEFQACVRAWPPPATLPIATSAWFSLERSAKCSCWKPATKPRKLPPNWQKKSAKPSGFRPNCAVPARVLVRIYGEELRPTSARLPNKMQKSARPNNSSSTVRFAHPPRDVFLILMYAGEVWPKRPSPC